MDPKSPSKLKFIMSSSMKWKRFSRICAVSFVILLVLVGGFLLFNSRKARDLLGNGYYSDSYYTVVVDCGSTGTRVNVYEWGRSVDSKDLPVLVHSYPGNLSVNLSSGVTCKYHCMQTEPGLDKFVGNATGVRKSLEPLILWAERWVPRERHGETPIFVLATAGLRRLPSAYARRILDDVEDVVKEHSFVYRRSWIRVLSGKEEAYFGWVALNYKMGMRGKSKNEPTLGLLDLGGSSLQVVMELNDGAREDDTNLIRSNIGSTQHQIVAFSLPSFGLNEAFDRTISMLSQAQPVVGSSSELIKLSHPCLGSDFVQNYSCHGCKVQNATYQSNLGGQVHEGEYVYLVGDPNWEQCKEIAKAAATSLSSSSWPKPNIGTHCNASLIDYRGSTIANLTDGTHQTGKFHALSGFFLVHSLLNLESRANWTEIWEKAHKLCSTSWTNLSSISGHPKYVAQYCFQVPYMASVVEDALCLGDSEIIFGPGDVSWTLGAAIVEGEFQWHIESRLSSMNISPFNYSPLFIFLVLLVLICLVYHSQVKFPVAGRKIVGVPPSLPSYNYPRRQAN